MTSKIGTQREATKHPAKVTVPDLKLAIATPTTPTAAKAKATLSLNKADTFTPATSPKKTPVIRSAGVDDPSVGVHDHSIGVGGPSTGVHDHSIGVSDPSSGVHDHSIGVSDPSSGVHDHSIGTDDPSAGVHDHSIGTGDDSGGVHDHSIGSGDDSGGVHDHSIGTTDDSALPELGPDRTTSENATKAQLKLYLESPSYLRNTTSTAAQAKTLLQQNIGADPNFTSLPTDQQSKFWSAFNAAGPKGKTAMGALMEGTPDVYSNTDSKGKTLIDNLASLASAKLGSSLNGKITPSDLMDQLVTTVANPDEIEQGTAPTCTVTSMEYEMARDNASEYARLVTGLAGSGSVQMRGGGTLSLPSSSANSDALDGRDTSQAVFQSAAMDYANGKATFDPVSGNNVNSSGTTSQGLSPTQQTTMLGQLFGVKYQTDTLADTASRTAELKSLGNFTAVGTNRPVLMEIDQGSFNHAVSLEAIRNGQVYFRDPYGTVRTMTEDAFKAHVVAIHKPVG